MNKRSMACAALAAALVFGACSDSDDDNGGDPTTTVENGGEATVNTLEVTTTDDGEGGGYTFEHAGSIEAGATQVAINNTGAEGHHVQLFKIGEDKTVDDVVTELQTGEIINLLKVGTFTGGTGVVDPGGESSAEAIADMTEGTYAFMCFVEGANGPHVANGMLSTVEVTAPEGEPATVPEADATIGLIDYGFELPETVEAGTTLDIQNKSQAEPHEVAMFKLADGATSDDLIAFFSSEGEPEGPPPASSVGGMQALLPGSSQSLDFDVEAGEYVFLCFIPSVLPDNEGKSHLELGMITQVTVS